MADEWDMKEQKTDHILVEQNSVLIRDKIIKLIQKYHNDSDTAENKNALFSKQPFSDSL